MKLMFKPTDDFFSSHKMGEVSATLARLTEVLGEPTEDNRFNDDSEGEFGPWDGKVAVEWHGFLALADGTTVAVAIWCWKGSLIYCDYASVWCERAELIAPLVAFIEGKSEGLPMNEHTALIG